ncbi:MAG: hypothetical protein AMXMBFR55_02590 [Gemmatimonadota bacterium]
MTVAMTMHHTRHAPRVPLPRRAAARCSAVLAQASILLALSACASDEVTNPGPSSTGKSAVASVEYIGTRAALFLDTGTGQRTKVVFNGASDPIPGNSPLLPPLADANLLALGPLSWSPTGNKLAMVATLAYDQSEVVVANADGSAPRVASPNTQIILSAPDWSPDESKLAYAMSTLGHALGVDIFVTDLTTNQVQRLTTGLNYSQLGGSIRFSSDGRFVFYSRPVAEGGAPLFDKVCEVWRIELATGARIRLADGINGTVQAISRSGTWALVIRRTGVLPGGDFDRALVRVPLTGSGPELSLIPKGLVQYAHLTNDDLRAIYAIDEATVAGSTALAFRSVAAVGGEVVAVRGTGAQTIVADEFFRP